MDWGVDAAYAGGPAHTAERSGSDGDRQGRGDGGQGAEHGADRRGERSRAAVLDRAVQMASTDGLGGLTFGTLAAQAPVGKSGAAR